MRETPKIFPMETLTHYLTVGYQTATRWLYQGKLILLLYSRGTVNPLYTDTRYNDKIKIRYYGNFTGKNSSLKSDSYQKLYKNMVKFILWIFVRIA